ncbi:MULTISPECIES: hypothetical protein [Streptomyces]|uniref:hypothetical protein n=1 Tax=Streptomyces TaxID=1883 RepID=UPI00103C9B91|nr:MULTISPECIES: hypothetical protein [Streptomyces]MBT3073555.1 hypothetical protein [Streptomyces sp. COG21]MBT3083465.1 hypothetical protein [Streptomyces sp. COG20]MBT3088476.1 hypothetical protein [Streptomyces sp. CYG21]MBT3098288.1 hypothetical protein [Streptomyces sp. CBG30]MBT3101896.1 hypothetical protein [Streptomyces sp. COG19]
MSRPDGWEWLDEPREQWTVPDSLRGPAASTQSNLAIAMLSCDFLGHEIVALVGRFIAEHSLLYLRPPGKGLGFREQALLADVLTRHTRRTFEAWERFKSSAEGDGPDEEIRRDIEASREVLKNELNSAISAFEELPASVI